MCERQRADFVRAFGDCFRILQEGALEKHVREIGTSSVSSSMGASIRSSGIVMHRPTLPFRLRRLCARVRVVDIHHEGKFSSSQRSCCAFGLCVNGRARENPVTDNRDVLMHDDVFLSRQ